jgi:hypothetical protein
MAARLPRGYHHVHCVWTTAAHVDAIADRRHLDVLALMRPSCPTAKQCRGAVEVVLLRRLLSSKRCRLEVELAGASVPVISTWWPLCCDRSEPSRTGRAAIGMLLGLPLPAVPAVVDAALRSIQHSCSGCSVDPAAAPPDAAGGARPVRWSA